MTTMMLMISLALLFNLVFMGLGLYQHKRLMVLEKKSETLFKTLAKHQMEQSAVVNADLIFAKKLTEINHQLVSMDNQLQALLTKRDNDGGYQHALRILEMGGDKEEIVNSCHLSNAEAELLMNLNAYRAVIKA